MTYVQTPPEVKIFKNIEKFITLCIINPLAGKSWLVGKFLLKNVTYERRDYEEYSRLRFDKVG